MKRSGMGVAREGEEGRERNRSRVVGALEAWGEERAK